MSKKTLDCYIIPGTPMPLLLPEACVAEVLAKPVIQPLVNAKTNWTEGHTTWRNQRLPVLNFSALLDSKLDESKKRNSRLIVLNPIPNAARKAYSGVLCYGDVKKITVEPNLDFGEKPKTIDKRYIDGIIVIGDQQFIVPKLVALGVAFSYF